MTPSTRPSTANTPKHKPQLPTPQPQPPKLEPNYDDASDLYGHNGDDFEYEFKDEVFSFSAKNIDEIHRGSKALTGSSWLKDVPFVTPWSVSQVTFICIHHFVPQLLSGRGEALTLNPKPYQGSARDLKSDFRAKPGKLVRSGQP